MENVHSSGWLASDINEHNDLLRKREEMVSCDQSVGCPRRRIQGIPVMLHKCDIRFRKGNRVRYCSIFKIRCKRKLLKLYNTL